MGFFLLNVEFFLKIFCNDFFIALFVGKIVLCHERLPRILCCPCPSSWCLCLGRILAKSQNHVRHAIIFCSWWRCSSCYPNLAGVPLISENSNFVNSHCKVTVNQHTCIFACEKISQDLREPHHCELNIVLKCLSLVYYYIIDENSSQRFSLSPINREIKLLQLKSWFTRFKISLEPPPPPTANKFIPQISSFLGERFLDPYTYMQYRVF